MTRRKKSKPYDPAAAERARQEREEAREMAQVIGAQPSTALNRDKHTGRLVSASRLNCFASLLNPSSVAAQAVNWFEGIVRASQGEADRQTIDMGFRAANDGLPGGPTDSMVAASRKLEVIAAFMPRSNFRLLLALVEPDAALLTRWRDHVQAITGETDKQAQGARVRAAAEAVAWVHESFPMLERAYEARRQRAA